MRQLLEGLFTQYYKDIYLYLYSLSRDSVLAEDLAQDVFLEVAKSISSFRGESDIKTWLFSIARHKWYAHLRKKNRQPLTEGICEFYESDEKTPEEQLQMELLIQRIFELLDQEPVRTQNIVKMRLDGYSFHEIGKTYGVSENSSRVIDFRAKTKIRQILKKEGLYHE